MIKYMTALHTTPEPTDHNVLAEDIFERLAADSFAEQEGLPDTPGAFARLPRVLCRAGRTGRTIQWRVRYKAEPKLFHLPGIHTYSWSAKVSGKEPGGSFSVGVGEVDLEQAVGELPNIILPVSSVAQLRRERRAISRAAIEAWETDFPQLIAGWVGKERQMARRSKTAAVDPDEVGAIWTEHLCRAAQQFASAHNRPNGGWSLYLRQEMRRDVERELAWLRDGVPLDEVRARRFMRGLGITDADEAMATWMADQKQKGQREHLGKSGLASRGTWVRAAAAPSTCAIPDEEDSVDWMGVEDEHEESYVPALRALTTIDPERVETAIEHLDDKQINYHVRVGAQRDLTAELIKTITFLEPTKQELRAGESTGHDVLRQVLTDDDGDLLSPSEVKRIVRYADRERWTTEKWRSGIERQSDEVIELLCDALVDVPGLASQFVAAFDRAARRTYAETVAA